MRKTEFLTALGIFFFTLFFFLGLEALHQTDMVNKICLDIAAIVALPIAIYLLRKAWSQIEKKETEEHEKRANETRDMQPLIEEMKGLRQDIMGFLRNEETKRTKGKTAKAKPKNK